jgi:hypothetical protein
MYGISRLRVNRQFMYVCMVVSDTFVQSQRTHP